MPPLYFLVICNEQLDFAHTYLDIFCYHIIMFSLGNYVPKERIDAGNFVLRKLEVRDVIMDYAAFMSSIEAIKKQRGGHGQGQILLSKII